MGVIQSGWQALIGRYKANYGEQEGSMYDHIRRPAAMVDTKHPEESGYEFSVTRYSDGLKNAIKAAHPGVKDEDFIIAPRDVENHTALLRLTGDLAESVEAARARYEAREFAELKDSTDPLAVIHLLQRIDPNYNAKHVRSRATNQETVWLNFDKAVLSKYCLEWETYLPTNNPEISLGRHAGITLTGSAARAFMDEQQRAVGGGSSLAR